MEDDIEILYIVSRNIQCPNVDIYVLNCQLKATRFIYFINYPENWVQNEEPQNKQELAHY